MMGGMGMGMNNMSPGRPDGPGMGDRPPEGGMDFPGRGPGCTLSRQSHMHLQAALSCSRKQPGTLAGMHALMLAAYPASVTLVSYFAPQEFWSLPLNHICL